jgi:hypothetical protein
VLYRRVEMATTSKAYKNLEKALGQSVVSKRIGIWNRKAHEGRFATSGIEYELVTAHTNVNQAISFFETCFPVMEGEVLLIEEATEQ